MNNFATKRYSVHRLLVGFLFLHFVLLCHGSEDTKMEKKTVSAHLSGLQEKLIARVDVSEVKDQCARLMSVSLSPKAKGQLYVGMVRQLASKNVIKYSDLILQLAHAARQYPLDIEDRIVAYEAAGNTLAALSVFSHEKGNIIRPEEILVEYISAFQVVCSMKAEDIEKPVPFVGMLTMPPNDPHYAEERKEIDREMEDRERVLLQNKLIYRYTNLVKSIKKVLFDAKMDRADLNAISNKALEGDKYMDKLILELAK